MDPGSTSESSIPPHDAVPGPSHYTGQSDLASQSLAVFLGGIRQSDVNVGPSSHPPHPYAHSYEPVYPFIPGYVPVPNIPHRQAQPYLQPAFLPAEVPGLLSQEDFHTPAQWDTTRWRDVNRQMKQAGMVTHDQFGPSHWIHDVPGPSAPRELPSTIVPNIIPSHVPSYTPSREQDSHRISRGHRNDEPGADPETERTHVESVSESPETPTKPSKKQKDMIRKRNQRANDGKYLGQICKLLEIPLSPKRTLSHRILLCVKELVDQRKVDEALRRRLEACESDLAVLREELKLAQDSNYTAGGSDIGASSLCPMGRGADGGHN